MDLMLDRQPASHERLVPAAADPAGSSHLPSGSGDGRQADDADGRDLRPAREAFLAVLSHELRTPITTIYAGSSILARHAGLPRSATRTLAGNISAEAARL